MDIRLALLFLALAGCQSVTGSHQPLIKNQPHLQNAAPPVYAEKTHVVLREQAFRIQAIPSAAQLIVFKVSGGALTIPLIQIMVLESEGLSAGFLNQLYGSYRSLAFKLPSGSTYLVQAEARDTSGQAIARGEVNFAVQQGNVTPATLTLLDIPLNQPPQIQTLTAQPDALAGAEHTTRLNCQATDPDNDSLSYSWSTVGGNFGSFSSTSASQVFWTAPAPASSSYTLRCSVSDGTHTVTQDRVISVANNHGSITGNGGLY